MTRKRRAPALTTKTVLDYFARSETSRGNPLVVAKPPSGRATGKSLVATATQDWKCQACKPQCFYTSRNRKYHLLHIHGLAVEAYKQKYESTPVASSNPVHAVTQQDASDLTPEQRQRIEQNRLKALEIRASRSHGMLIACKLVHVMHPYTKVYCNCLFPCFALIPPTLIH